MTAIHETMSPSSKNVRSEQLGEKQDQLISKNDTFQKRYFLVIGKWIDMLLFPCKRKEAGRNLISIR